MGEGFWGQVCGDVLTGQKPVLLALFLAGLGSSVTHCLTMCSGFVLAQTGALSGRGSMARLLLPYHAGRVTTYTLLGLIAGAGFHLLAGWSGFTLMRHFLLAVVAVSFLAMLAGRLLQHANVVLPIRLPVICDLSTLKRVAAATAAWRRYGLGLTLGLLPCPMVFTALLAVGVTADPLMGAVGMALFGLGTMPALLGLAFASGNLLNSSPRLQNGLTLAALGVNGVILLAMAVS